MSPGPRNAPASGPEGARFPAEDVREPSYVRDSESDIAALFAKFEENSGGTLSPQFSADLALEIVLNEIVEQACLATAASGAAVVLWRGGELVCRASTGASAPALGAQMDSRSGLSGLCLQTGRAQLCDDTLTHPHADPEASRRLGVRSVMVVPLARPTGVLGILEVMSATPFAFGERDERTLEVLARRVLRNVERAADPFLLRDEGTPRAEQVDPRAMQIDPRAMHVDPRTIEDAYLPQPAFEEAAFDADEFTAPLSGPIFGNTTQATAPPRAGTDVLTALMGLILLAGVVLLGVLTGRRLGWNILPSGAKVAKASSRAASQRSDPVTPAASASDPVSGVASDPVSAGKSAALSSSTAQPAAKLASSSPASSSLISSNPVSSNAPQPSKEVPDGGLRVYENGKPVFQLPASHPDAAPRQESQGQVRAAEFSPDTADANVIHRVEPEYPEQARAKQLQGKVILKLRVGPDGEVDDIQLVAGDPLLAQAAINAVMQWRFKPQGSSDRAEKETQVTLNFRLPPQ